MRRLRRLGGLLLVPLAVSAALLVLRPAFFWRSPLAEATLAAQETRLSASPAAAIAQGRYIAQLAGCHSCHGADLSGGVAIASDFGTFYAPNITTAALGDWSLADFAQAMTAGIDPETGLHYYPSFPYGHYRDMAAEDLVALYLYLRAQPPVSQQSRPHDLRFPANIRSTLSAWRLLFGGQDVPPPPSDPLLARGAYVMNNLLHCSACHTPRNAAGAPRLGQFLKGNPDFPDRPAPDISMTALAEWSAADLEELLRSGFTRDFDVVAGEMAEVVHNSSQHLTAEDMAALIAYWQTIR